MNNEPIWTGEFDVNNHGVVVMRDGEHMAIVFSRSVAHVVSEGANVELNEEAETYFSEREANPVGLLAVQANRAGTNTNDQAYSNVRLYQCDGNGPDFNMDREGPMILGHRDTFAIIHPTDIGLDEWNGQWNDDCGYLTDDQLSRFMIDVAAVQAR